MRSPDSPERAFDRAWAQSVLKAAMRKLRREAAQAGKAELFGKLWEFVIERPDDTDYERIAAELNMRRNTLAVAVHRLRHRLRDLVCAELAETASDEATLDQEIADLRQCLGGVLER
jgi:RNA polymerase sigma-70 factor (ECF subfamily)